MESPQEFLSRYEQASNSHQWKNVKPLIASDAIYWFSDGSHEGIEQIGEAFERTWSRIKEEVYKLENVEWLFQNSKVAACIYDFKWEGIIDGKQAAGQGRGTNIMKKQGNAWTMIHEHLSKQPK